MCIPFRTLLLLFVGGTLLFINACGGDSDDDPDPVATFNKNTSNYVNYTLGSEKHVYREGRTYFSILGNSSSIGARSRHDYSFGLASFQNGCFDVTTGTLTHQGGFLLPGKFYDFFQKGSYSYGLDSINPGVSLTFVDDAGEFWYSDSVKTQTGSFDVTDTLGFIGPDLYPYKKIKANFSCEVGQSKNGPSKKVTNGSMVVIFSY